MARQPRLDLPGIAQHVVQRGNDRHVCFAADTDYLRYLQELREASSKHDCAIHAYVLMTNHVHLLATPAATGGISRMMQAVGRRYVGSFNARDHRTGTLWEGRFKAALVDTDRYLLTCYRYIELNPVRAHMTDNPADYPWSSYHHNALGQFSPLITPHAQYTILGPYPTQDKPPTAR
jgi:putative transposase